MRNLLGRLNARSPEELLRIAAAWQVPVAAGDRPGLVSRLYRALTDPRTVRDCWHQLPEHERTFVRLLSVGEETAMTLPELAAHLGVSEAEARQIAIRLYHKGIVAREGDDEPLPVGVLPRLFLPRELVLLFRRVQDEIEAGDVSETPLRALLALLDDRELEEAAETWGLRVIPGLRNRDDLTRQILQQVSDVDRVAAVAAKQRRDAALIWRRLRAEPDGAPVALPEAAAAAGLTADDAKHAQRLREALAELEGALLVWHTYRMDGSRWLFIPTEIRAPRPTTPSRVPTVEPLTAPLEEEPPWRHRHALAWDLLTLLRALSAPDAPRAHSAAVMPRSWLRRLNHGLWNRGADLPPAGYVTFLTALARAEGVLRGGDGPGEEPLTVTPAVRLWRDRSFDDQTARLQWWWLASQDWIEGSDRDEVAVWGAEWIPFRRKLLAQLAALHEGVWYALDEVTAWLAARDPEMLGAIFTAATARQIDQGEDDTSRRRATIAQVAAVTLETAFAWFGLIELATVRHGPRALRVTPVGLAAANASPTPPAGPPVEGPPLRVLPSLTIELRDPTPLRVWSLSAFAEVERLDHVSLYRLTEPSLERALAAGFEVQQITAFLARQSGSEIPPELQQQIAAWAREYRRVRLRRSVVAIPDDPAHLAHLEQIARAAGLPAHVHDGSLLIELGPSEARDAEDALVSLLREAGFSPHWANPGPKPADRSG